MKSSITAIFQVNLLTQNVTQKKSSSTPQEVLTKISHPKKVTTKFQTQKKSSDRKFQTQKRASHIPVTYIPEYPPWDSILINDHYVTYLRLLHPGGGYSKQFYTGRLRPEVQPLTLLYTIFFRKGTPFVYLLLEKGTPFIYLL